MWVDAHVWEHERFDGTFTHDQVLVVGDISRVTEAIEVVLMEDLPHV